MEHINFWWNFAGKVGAPMFTATFVACLLSGKLQLLHFILMAAGRGLMWFSHWREYHYKGRKDKSGLE